MATQAVEFTPLTGRVLSRYQIGERLGEGGMGVVYRAHDLRLGRPVALKFLREEVCSRGSVLERLQREARVASSLNHPHICTIHDVELLGGRPFLVMELLEGATLAERLREGPLPLGKFLDLALQLAEALSAAHAKGVVHRDLKPGNVFVTHDGRVKVVDFGIAHSPPPVTGLTTSVYGLRTALLEGVAGPLTSAGLVAGSLPYMAPEQARSAAADTRTDLFSFGAVLYEMATGRRAFGGFSADEVQEAVLNHTPPPPSRVEPGLPPALDGVILKALRKSPKDRYQTAGEMRASLLHLRGKDAVRGLRTAGGLPIEGAPERMEAFAVMPVRALATDAEGEILADGVTDVLVSALARVRGVRVVSLTSVMSHKATSSSLPEFARELGVDGVVEGCLLLFGGRARITARLFRAERDCCVWGRVCEGDRGDVLALQRQLARALARQARIEWNRGVGGA